MTRALFAALLLAAGLAHAQDGARFDCSRANDPKACEERRDKMKAMQAQAEKECAGRQGMEQRECMMKQMCAQAPDPKRCEERAARMKDNAKSAAAACQGRPGAEHDECMAQEFCSQEKDSARCEAEAKARLARREKMEKMREACKDKSGEELKACIREQRG